MILWYFTNMKCPLELNASLSRKNRYWMCQVMIDARAQKASRATERPSRGIAPRARFIISSLFTVILLYFIYNYE